MAEPAYKFDIYGRYVLEIARSDDGWRIIKRIGDRRLELHDFAIPSFLSEGEEIAIYLDDILHESSGPGDVIRRIG